MVVVSVVEMRVVVELVRIVVEIVTVVVEVARVVLDTGGADVEEVLKELVELETGLPPSAAWKSAIVS